MKLLSIHLPNERPKALSYVREIDLARPVVTVTGWIIAVRGPSVVLIAPSGSPMAGGYEIPRALCTLRWDSSNPADYDKMANWTSEPLVMPEPRPEGEPEPAATAQPHKDRK